MKKCCRTNTDKTDLSNVKIKDKKRSCQSTKHTSIFRPFGERQCLPLGFIVFEGIYDRHFKFHQSRVILRQFKLREWDSIYSTFNFFIVFEILYVSYSGNIQIKFNLDAPFVFLWNNSIWAENISIFFLSKKFHQIKATLQTSGNLLIVYKQI